MWIIFFAFKREDSVLKLWQLFVREKKMQKKKKKELWIEKKNFINLANILI